MKILFFTFLLCNFYSTFSLINPIFNFEKTNNKSANSLLYKWMIHLSNAPMIENDKIAFHNSYLKNIGHGVILSSDLLRDFDVNNTIYTLNCQNNNLAIAICTNVDKKLYIDNLSINPDYRSYHIKILAVVINYLNITSQDQKVILNISRLPDFMKFDINFYNLIK